MRLAPLDSWHDGDQDDGKHVTQLSGRHVSCRRGAASQHSDDGHSSTLWLTLVCNYSHRMAVVWWCRAEGSSPGRVTIGSRVVEWRAEEMSYGPSVVRIVCHRILFALAACVWPTMLDIDITCCEMPRVALQDETTSSSTHRCMQPVGHTRLVLNHSSICDA